ncbi:protein kinase [Aureococcus anophagefferens]|nr:protein kinase [Aureococcus anophagefferens]
MQPLTVRKSHGGDAARRSTRRRAATDRPLPGVVLDDGFKVPEFAYAALPENLGLTDARRLKLLDFGLAVALEKEDAAAFELTGDTGSRRYMAPEVAKQRPYAAPVDVYSAAIVSAEVLGLHRAFAGLSLEDHERRVIDGGLRPRLQASPRLQALFAALWDGDAGKRRDAASARDELAAVVAADSDPLRATPSCACVLS